MQPFTNPTGGFIRRRPTFCSRMLVPLALISVSACGNPDPIATGPAAGPVAAVQHAVIIPITSCPYLITNAGQYRLDTATCNGIVVDHSDVVLNLHDGVVSGSGCNGDPSVVGIAVRASSSNVRITNGRVQDFGTGLQVAGNGSRLDHLDVTANCTGIQLVNASSNRLDRDRIVRNEGDGVVLGRSSNNRIELSVISENAGAGIILLASDSNVVADDTISANGGRGVILSSQSAPALPGANSNTITRNVVDDAGSGLSDGINVQVGANNTITRNTVRRNHHGITLDSATAIGNSVLRNTVLMNADGDLLDGNHDCDQNIWRNNIFTSKNKPCIH